MLVVEVSPNKSSISPPESLDKFSNSCPTSGITSYETNSNSLGAT